ncbi:hypothetical protein OUZ56_033029 [Daphnia magna]|uniref:Uncharacterized protein n=1 Tax=Daphnia magna TaxID=35525 RepID=A0ABR0BA22_9CRUS|nr:hypothetical protein OUZ56_033029 [Daphnia magna]
MAASEKPIKRKALVDRMYLDLKQNTRKAYYKSQSQTNNETEAESKQGPEEETTIINQDTGSAASADCIDSSHALVKVANLLIEMHAVGGIHRMDTTINIDSVISSSVQLDTSGVTVYPPSSSPTNNQSFEEFCKLGTQNTIDVDSSVALFTNPADSGGVLPSSALGCAATLTSEIAVY